MSDTKFYPQKGQDWCHLCGFRSFDLVGFDVPGNAEDLLLYEKDTNVKNKRFMRLCVTCWEEGLNAAIELRKSNHISAETETK